jgi:adenylate kinase family enzyme
MSNFNFFNNINVIGTSGSGKTTFSKSVANILNIKYIELDSLYWNANWVESDDTEFIRKIKVIITYEKWVIQL